MATEMEKIEAAFTKAQEAVVEGNNSKLTLAA